MLIETTFPQSRQVLAVSLWCWRRPSGHTHQMKKLMQNNVQQVALRVHDVAATSFIKSPNRPQNRTRATARWKQQITPPVIQHTTENVVFPQTNSVHSPKYLFALLSRARTHVVNAVLNIRLDLHFTHTELNQGRSTAFRTMCSTLHFTSLNRTLNPSIQAKHSSADSYKTVRPEDKSVFPLSHVHQISTRPLVC